ncbi:ribonuclease P protein component [Flavicella sediminum]|uniref:ribonuclease P protein component n=1 Tax=Flavicella sediminum TaxID=2585141 RepID=UPI00111DC2C5|nr:ribonuclease P protein component [Flavicella sediminum]
MKFTYGKQEKLKSKKSIEEIFEQGEAVSSYPFRLIFVKKEISENPKILAGVSVPKRKVNKAVYRSKIKRLMRESYRLNKYLFLDGITANYNMMLVYVAKEAQEMEILNVKMQKLAQKFQAKIANE